jgi:anti-sigma B factor antagonist
MVTSEAELSHCTAPEGTAVIAAPASFDIYSAPAVRALAIRLQRGGAASIVIDLAAVTFMDSSALGVILGTQARLRAAGGDIAVASASEPVAAMFSRAGLGARIAMYPDASAAADGVTAQ